MEIGKPQKVIESEPVEDPFKRDEPVREREQTPEPEPVRTPEPERVGSRA